MAKPEIEWVAVDWGTSRLRCWLMDGGNNPFKSLSSTKGMAGLAQHEFEPALLELIGEYLATDKKTKIIACGMVGARQGWSEAPYATLPVSPGEQIRLHRVKAEDKRLEVFILPGISQSEPPDVMRGEETQIAGFLVDKDACTGTVCMPGTHSKWVTIEGGKITGFTTCMTGELFAVLTTNTVLRHSVEQGWDETRFEAGVMSSLQEPQGLVSRLFAIRAGDLLHDAGGDGAYSFLSGLLIGAELAAMDCVRNGAAVTLVGGENLCRPYALALELAGCNSHVVSGDEMVLEGLKAVYNSNFGKEVR